MRIRKSMPIAGVLLLGSSSIAPASATDTASAAATATATASAAASAAAGSPPESLPFLGPVPEEKSKPPTPAEWKAARDVSAPISTSDCTVRRVREWLRVRCEPRLANTIDLVAGNANDVYFSLNQGGGTCIPDPTEGDICWDVAEAVFPMRRGDRRFFQVSIRNMGGGYMVGTVIEPFVVFSEVWLQDEPGPVVTIGKVE